MKLLVAVPVQGVIGGVLGWGIQLAVQDEPGWLIAGWLGCATAFAGLGCLPKRIH
jgi:hypothetical protein